MKRNTQNLFFAAMVVLSVSCISSFWGCGEQNDPVVVAVNPNDSGDLLLAPGICIYWPLASEAAKNEAIVNKAREEVGIVYACGPKREGQCKWWVQNQLIPKASYGLAKIIPMNDETHPVYWYAKWLDEGVRNVRIVLRSTGTCFWQFPTSIIKPGNVFQVRWKKGGLHTFVVEGITADSISCIDCNFDGACKTPPVSGTSTRIVRHPMSRDYFNSNVAAFTLYQIL